MPQKSLIDTFEKNRYDFSIAKKSRAWFEGQATLLSKKRITPKSLLKQGEDQLTTNMIPGNLYLFNYDPKLKKTLPYYDTYPMVFPWKKVPGGFIGINMHYLPYFLRIRLMDKLLEFRNNDKMDGTTKLKFSWGLIDGVARFAPAGPCVKHYLDSQVRSPFLKIKSQDWPTAMMMPVERFVGATKDEVWAESIKRI